jgi:hypothetical protein
VASVTVSKPARMASIEATVTRADGRVENLGVIAYWHKNPLKRWTVNLGIAFRRLFR